MFCQSSVAIRSLTEAVVRQADMQHGRMNASEEVRVLLKRIYS